jgi:hypothetical protein
MAGVSPQDGEPLTFNAAARRVGWFEIEHRVEEHDHGFVR